MKKKLTINLPMVVVEQIDRRKAMNEGNRSEQISADLSEYWQILEQGLTEARRELTRNQAKLILDATNGAFLNFTYGNMLKLMIFGEPSGLYQEVADHIELNNADTKWGVDGDATKKAVYGLSPIAVMAMLDFSRRFWADPEADTDEAVEIFKED